MFALTFSVVVLLSIGLIFQQHRVAVEGTGQAIQTYQKMASAREIFEALSELEQGEKFLDQDELGMPAKAFESLRLSVFRARTEKQSPEANAILERISDDIREMGQTFIGDRDGLLRGPRDILRKQHDKLSDKISQLMALNEVSVYRLANELNKSQERSVTLAIGFLLAFIVLLVAVGYRLIAVMTRPLTSLGAFVDEFNPESLAPVKLPVLTPDIPEISNVAKSFERLMSRLQGFRTVNVQRLLAEKRRADVIAASISDGIFLLKDSELVYRNPIAERILDPERGMRMSQEASLELGGIESPGARAVLDAVERALPVELSLEAEGRRYHYLLQAYPISFDALEQFDPGQGSAVPELEKFHANMLVVARDVTVVKESQEAKGHFLATISHEVKTPVTSLTMATRLLARSADQFENPTHRSLVQTCATEVDRLRGLLDELLTVSRFDGMTERLEIQQVDLLKLLRHTLQSFAAPARERCIAYNMQIRNSGKVALIAVDPAKVAWAVSNLVLNALRHTPKYGRVDAIAELLEDRVEVRIRDTGPGIERKRQKAIFDKFSSFYDIRVARSGGAGAGLSIAREIVLAHGGKIWVTSESGEGAEFCFTLPLTRTRQPKEIKPSELRNVSTSEGARSGELAVPAPSGPEVQKVTEKLYSAMNACHSSLRKGELSGASACS